MMKRSAIISLAALALLGVTGLANTNQAAAAVERFATKQVGQVSYVVGKSVSLSSGKTVKTGSKWKTRSINQATNGSATVNLGTGSDIDARYFDLTSESSTQTLSGVAQVHYVKGYGIAIWTTPANKKAVSGKKLAHGSRWKVFKRAVVHGHTWYNLGGNQWADSTYFKLTSESARGNKTYTAMPAGATVAPVVKAAASQAALRSKTVIAAIAATGPSNPLIFSHRGVPAVAPEHSFAGYDAAISQGSAFIEPDVHLSLDGTLYVSHDDNLKRTTGYNLSISTSTDAQLSQVKLSNGESLHTLTELFNRYGKSVHFIPEAKVDASDTAYQTEAALVATIKQYGQVNNVILQDLSLGGLTYMHSQAGFGNVPTLWLQTTYSEAAILTNTALAPSWLTFMSININNATQAEVDAVHARNMRVSLWTSSNTANDKQAFTLGADSIFTNSTSTTLYNLGQTK